MKLQAPCLIAALLIAVAVAARAEEPPPAALAEESERNLEDWVRDRCPAFTAEKQHSYWMEMRTRYRQRRQKLCALKQGGKEMVYAPFTLGVSLLSASQRYDRCLDNDFEWRFQSQLVTGRLDGYRPGESGSPDQPNSFFVTLRNSGVMAMRDIRLTCDLIDARLRQISSSPEIELPEPVLSGQTRTVSVELDPHDRWFCYSMCVYRYTTDY